MSGRKPTKPHRNALAAAIAVLRSAEWLKQCPVGRTVLFGSCEQDNDEMNGAEPIEWTVLKREDGKILVISRYELGCQRYKRRCLGELHRLLRRAGRRAGRQRQLPVAAKDARLRRISGDARQFGRFRR